jgi:TP901 family phage tail tape measure protein
MALEKMGLEANLIFKADEAIKNMNAAAESFKSTTAAAKGLTAEATKAASGGGGKGGKTKDPYANFGKGLSTGFYRIGEGARNFAFAMAPVTYAMGQGVKSGIEYEAKLMELQAITGSDSDQMKVFAKSARQLGYEFGALPTEVLNSTLELSKLGVENKDLASVVPTTMRAMRAEGMSLTEATTALGMATTVFGRSWGESSDTLDTLQAAANASSASIVSLSRSLGKSGGSVKKLGFSFEETAGTLGLVTSTMGKEGAKAGSVFQNMMDSVASPEGRSKKSADLIESLGLKLPTADKSGNMPRIHQWAKQWNTQITKQLGKGGAVAAIDTIFGKIGGRGFSALVNATQGAIDTMDNALANRSGLTQKIAMMRMQTTKAQYERFSSAVSSVNNEVWMGMKDNFVNGIPLVSKGIINVANAMSELRQAEPGKREGMVAGLKKQFGSGAVDTALGLLDTMDWVTAKIKSLVDSLKDLGNWFESAFAGGRRALIGFLGKAAVVSAILPFVSVFVWAISSTIIPLFTGIGSIAAAVFPKIAGSMGGLLPIVGRFVGALVPWIAVILLFWNALKPIFPFFMSVFSGIWTAIEPLFRGVVMLFDLIGTAMSALGDTLKMIFDGLAASFGGTGDGIVGVVKFVCEVIVQAFGLAIVSVARMFNWLGDKINEIRNWIQNTMADFEAFMADLNHTFGGSDAEYQRKMDKINFIRKSTDEERLEQIDAYNKKQEKMMDDMFKKIRDITEKNTKPTAVYPKEGAENFMGSVNVNLKTETTVKSDLKMDGKTAAAAISKHEEEILERNGAKPWRRGVTLGLA